MTLYPLTSITYRLMRALLKKGEIILTNDTLNDRKRCMP
jgi:hypothetical protein